MSNNPTSPLPARGRKWALLIGSQLAGLGGQANDLETMERVLDSYGFVSTRCFDESAPYTATRAGILKAWDALINDSRPGDTVVIYYSGHGMLRKWQGERDSSTRRPLQYILPIDFGETRVGDWRGITDVELSLLLARTTKITPNVTLILDCCHSARMARGDGIVKTPDNDAYGEILAHIDNMMENGQFDACLHHERNADAVFIVAAPQTESAYETTLNSYGDDGSLVERKTGVLTHVLAAVLREAIPESVRVAGPTQISWQPSVSWRSIMLNVRDRIKLDFPSQVPQVEGNDLRFAFCLDEADSRGVLSLSRDGGRVALSGGRLHNVSRGDVYSVQPFEIERVAQATEIARATVEDVGPLTSWVVLSPDAVLPAGARAFPVQTAPATFQVEIDAPRHFEMLADELNKSEFVRPRSQGDLPVLATVSLQGSRLSLRHHYGGGVHLLREWDIPDGQDPYVRIRDCTKTLENLAWAQHLLTCRVDLGEDTIAEHLKVEFGLVDVGGNKQPLDQKKMPEVMEGRKLYVEMTSKSTATLYVSIFDVCAASVTLVTTSSPDGIELANYGSYVFGRQAFETRIKGQTANWPDATSKDSPIPEDLVLVVTDRKIDLRNLQTGHQHRVRRSGQAETELAKLINRIGTGIRKVEMESESPVRFGILRLPFLLTPARVASATN